MAFINTPPSTLQNTMANLQLNSGTIPGAGQLYGNQQSPFTQVSLTPINSVNIKGLSLAPSTSGWVESDTTYVKKYEVIEPSENILTLSCTWNRLRKNKMANSLGIATLLQRELFSKITAEDRELADKIRDYYSQKIMVWTLKGQRLSQFREDLKTFVNEQSNKTTEKMLPMVYRLPEFYAYDVEFDEMIRDLNKDQSKLKSSFQLTPLKCFKKHRKFNKKNEYWMKDDDGYVYVINLMHDNPLLHLWEREFTHADSLNITGESSRHRRDNLNYIELTKWTLG